MTPDECEHAICEICANLGLWVLLERFLRETRIEARRSPSAFRFEDGAIAERISFAEEEPRHAITDRTLALPAALGWVTLSPSRIEDRVLFMADLGAKSDWFDMECMRSFENPASIRLFNKMAPRLRRMLPYVARNRWTGDTTWHNTRVRHSAGVVDWVKSGGRIKQWIAPGIDYTVDATCLYVE